MINHRTSAICVITMIAMLLLIGGLFTSCKTDVPVTVPKERFRVEAFFEIDGQLYVAGGAPMRATLQPPRTVENAWVIAGIGQYDYNEPLQLSIRRAPGATGATFNVSNSWKVEYIYFNSTTGYTGLPKSDVSAPSWAKTADFKRLFESQLGNRVEADITMVVKLSKHSGVVEVVTE